MTNENGKISAHVLGQINPCLYVVEGNQQALADPQHVRDQIEETETLEGAAAAHISDWSIEGILGLLEEFGETFLWAATTEVLTLGSQVQKKRGNPFSK